MRTLLVSLLGVSLSLSVGLLNDVLRADVPELDRQEILRRGDMVTYTGVIRGDADRAVADVLGPPVDDSHKWFVTVIRSRNCVHCERLLADLQRVEALKAWVDVRDHRASWSHFNVYDAEDRTQAWRWKGIQIQGYPTVLLQPPRNKAYGDPSTVVIQITGYETGEKLAKQLRDAIVAYVRRVHPIQRGTAARGHGQAESDGFGQPFTPGTPTVLPSPSSTPFPFPPDPTPSQPVEPGIMTALTLLLQLSGNLLGSGSLQSMLLFGLVVMAAIRTYRKQSGQPLVLSAEQFALVSTLLSGSQPPPSTPSKSSSAA